MQDRDDWLQTFIPDWAALKPKERGQISDFALFWSLFELHAQKNKASVRRIIDAVDRLERYAEYQEVADAVNYFSDRYFNGPDAPERFERLRLSSCAKAVVFPVMSGEDERHKERLKAVLLIIHRLRNNFFHGEKAKLGYVNQIENFKASNEVLMAVIPLWVR